MVRKGGLPRCYEGIPTTALPPDVRKDSALPFMLSMTRHAQLWIIFHIRFIRELIVDPFLSSM